MLDAAAQRRSSLRKEARILPQYRGQYERPEEFAGGIARHGRAEALAISLRSLGIAVRVVFGLRNSGTGGGGDERGRRCAVVHKQLELFPGRQRALRRGNVGKEN